MDKIAIGPNLPNDIIDLDNSPKTNLQNLAKAKKCNISDLTVMILDRPRHSELIAKSREAGARVKLISDGDIAAAIATTNPDKTGIDIYMGIGGAPEGVLAASALKVSNSQMLGRLIFNDNQKQIDRAKKMGITDLNKKYSINQMVKGDSLFIASGVTNGSMLDGVVRNDNYNIVNSIIMDSVQKSIKIINSKYLK
jgi:fructose-1,6-bisphosphatase II / sedoheptulose-1,7-bisphosphatase